MHSGEPMCERIDWAVEAVVRVRSTAMVAGTVAFHERISLRRLIPAFFFWLKAWKDSQPRYCTFVIDDTIITYPFHLRSQL